MQSRAVFPAYSNPNIDRYHEQDTINVASPSQPRYSSRICAQNSKDKLVFLSNSTKSTRPKSRCKERPTFILAYDSPAKREASRPQTVDVDSDENSNRLTRPRITSGSKPRHRHTTSNGDNVKQSSQNVIQGISPEHRALCQITNLKKKELKPTEATHKNGDGPPANFQNRKITTNEHNESKENCVYANEFLDYREVESLIEFQQFNVPTKTILERFDVTVPTDTVIKKSPLKIDTALLDAYQRIDELEDTKKFCEQEIITLREDLSKAKTIIDEQSKKIHLAKPGEGTPWIAVSKTCNHFNPNSDYFALRSFENSGFNVLHAHLIRRYRSSVNNDRRVETHSKANVAGCPVRSRLSHSFGGDKSYLELYRLKKDYQVGSEAINCKYNRTRSLPHKTRLFRNSNVLLLTNSGKPLRFKSKSGQFGQKSAVEYLAIAVASREGLIREIAHSVKKAKRILHFRFNTLITSDFSIQDFHFLLTSHRRFVRWLHNYINYSVALMNRFDTQYMKSSRFYLPASVEINGNQVKGIFIPMPSSTNVPEDASDNRGNSREANNCFTQTSATLQATNLREVGIQALQSHGPLPGEPKCQRSRSVQFRPRSKDFQHSCDFSARDGFKDNCSDRVDTAAEVHPLNKTNTEPSTPAIQLDQIEPALSRRNIAFQWFQSKSQKIHSSENVSAAEAEDNERDLNADTVLGCLPKEFKLTSNIAANFPFSSDNNNVLADSCLPSGGDSICRADITIANTDDEPIAKNYHQLITCPGDFSAPQERAETLSISISNSSAIESTHPEQPELTGSNPSIEAADTFQVAHSPLDLILPTEAEAAAEFFNHRGNAVMRALDPETFIGTFNTEAEEKLLEHESFTTSEAVLEATAGYFSSSTDLNTKLKTSLTEFPQTEVYEPNVSTILEPENNGMSRTSTPGSMLEACYSSDAHPDLKPQNDRNSLKTNDAVDSFTKSHPPAPGIRKSRLPVLMKPSSGKFDHHQTEHLKNLTGKHSNYPAQNPGSFSTMRTKTGPEKNAMIIDRSDKFKKPAGNLKRSTLIPTKK